MPEDFPIVKFCYLRVDIHMRCADAPDDGAEVVFQWPREYIPRQFSDYANPPAVYRGWDQITKLLDELGMFGWQLAGVFQDMDVDGNAVQRMMLKRQFTSLQRRPLAVRLH